MTSTIDSLHKILKDETRRKIIRALSEKGSLTYTDLTESLNIVSTGTLNYHLKILGDLTKKNDSGQYLLSEKGQLAYRVLTEFPNEQSQVADKRIFKAWIILFAATVATTILNGNFFIPLQRTVLILAIEILSFSFAFYIRIRPSHSGNRAFFIAVGALGLGFIFWFIVTSIILFSGIRWQIVGSTGNLGDDFVVTATVIICWVVGGFVGGLIGKRRNYIIPTLRV
jgi:DNA-binding transcriptional ArsR family regulator